MLVAISKHLAFVSSKHITLTFSTNNNKKEKGTSQSKGRHV